MLIITEDKSSSKSVQRFCVLFVRKIQDILCFFFEDLKILSKKICLFHTSVCSILVSSTVIIVVVSESCRNHWK